MKNSEAGNGVYELESPFKNLTSFKQRSTLSSNIPPNESFVRTPFKSIYELEGFEQGYGEDGEAVDILDYLYDEEFEDLVQEIAFETQELINEQRFEGYGAIQNAEVAKRTLEENYRPFLNELEHLIRHADEIAEAPGAENMTDDEWEASIDRYVVQMEHAPNFEHWGWFKKAVNKVKKVGSAVKRAVKKGVNIAKKLGFGFLVKRLNRILFKFLRGLLAKGINILPRKYRGLARTLAKKIGVLKEVEGYENDGSFLSNELDLFLTDALVASEEGEIDEIEEEFLIETGAMEVDAMNQLDIARERFVEQLATMEEGQDPEVAIEQFVPAVLLGLKWGIKILGKKRVMKTLTNLAARFAGKYIGKRNARKLSRHLVGAGFKLLNLELSPQQEIEEGNRILAQVVEDTITQVAQEPEHIINNQELFEGSIIRAFENAAARGFPDEVLSEETFLKRPDLRESAKHRVAWKLKALGKGKRKKCRYKKLNREYEVELDAYMVDEIKTHGGISLGRSLRDQMGVLVNGRMPVKVHLYETLPGASPLHIGKNEAILSTIRRAGIKTAFSQIHPLTSVAAGVLLGEPALGCRSKSKCFSGNQKSAAHRYYYLEIPGASPQMFTASTGVRQLRKASSLKIKLNFVKNQIELFLFLSESDAQNVASLMRQQRNGNAARLGMVALEGGLKTAFSKHTTDNIMIVHPKIMPGKYSGKAMDYIPVAIQRRLKEKLNAWIQPKLTDHLMRQSAEFIKAADADADGVTICITTDAPVDLKVMDKLISFKKIQLPEILFREGLLEMNIKVKPGYQYV